MSHELNINTYGKFLVPTIFLIFLPKTHIKEMGFSGIGVFLKIIAKNHGIILLFKSFH